MTKEQKKFLKVLSVWLRNDPDIYNGQIWYDKIDDSSASLSTWGFNVDTIVDQIDNDVYKRSINHVHDDYMEDYRKLLNFILKTKTAWVRLTDKRISFLQKININHNFTVKND